MKITALATALALGIASSFTVSSALAGEMDGNWRTESGETVKMYSGCGGVCGELTTGKHSGTVIVKMKGRSGKYNGTVLDPGPNKLYSGSAVLQGNKIKLQGCALKIFCKTQYWKKM